MAVARPGAGTREREGRLRGREARGGAVVRPVGAADRAAAARPPGRAGPDGARHPVVLVLRGPGDQAGSAPTGSAAVCLLVASDVVRCSRSYRAVDCMPIATTKAVSSTNPRRVRAGHITIGRSPMRWSVPPEGRRRVVGSFLPPPAPVSIVRPHRSPDGV